MTLERTQKGEVLDQPTLVELRDIINFERDAAGRLAGRALEHAARAGEALIVAKGLVARGQWVQWLEANLHMSACTAQRHMRIAELRDHLPEHLATIQEAEDFLRERGLTRKRGSGPRVDPRKRSDALALIEHEGLSMGQAAKAVGVSYMTIHAWVNPDAAIRRFKRSNERRRHAARAEEALRRQERQRAIKDAVRSADAALAEAYARAESFDRVIAQAHRVATDRDVREALSLATSHYHKMRDEIVRALGVTG